MKRDVTQYFPVRYGIQDHDLIFNAFFEEVSQAYQEGEIYKGGAKLEPEMGHDGQTERNFIIMEQLRTKAETGDVEAVKTFAEAQQDMNSLDLRHKLFGV